MAVCRYFMEGYCRYGQRCKFKHPYNNSRDTDYYGYEEQNYKPSHQNTKGYSGVSILRGGNAQQSSNNESSFSNSNYNAGTGFSRPNYSTPSNFGGVNYNTSSGGNQRTNVSNQNVHDIVAATLKEIETIENGHQWPLTCFCPLRDASNVPGWVDHSPEELRWEIYKASKDGTFEQCKVTIQQLFKEAQDRRNDFKSRDKAVNIVENMLQKKKSSSTTATGATAPNFFQQNTSASQNATTSGFFQNNTSAIQNTNTSSFFPQNNTPAGHSDVYNPAPMFGSASQPFGSNFANPQTPVAAAQPTVFHDPAPAFSFSLNQNSTNSFNTNTPSSVFQSVPNQPSSNQDVFNRMPKASVQDYNGNTVYSNLSDLDKSELASFQANVFDFGQVPLKPPPKELC